MGLLLFKKCFLEAIRTGAKQTTVRRWSRPRVRAGGRAFSPGVGWVWIDDVDEVDLRELDDSDAQADGFCNVAEMRRELRRIYPQVKKDGKTWFRVKFRVAP